MHPARLTQTISPFCWMLACAVLLTMASPVSADPLPLGETIQGVIQPEIPLVYEFEAEEAGALMVVVRSSGDVSLEIVNTDGGEIPDPYCDGDWLNDVGAEQKVFILELAGSYEVIVTSLDSASFTLGATWLPMDELAREIAPHSSPATARPISPGDSFEGVLSGYSDWYRLESTDEAMVQISVLTNEGDLAIQLFTEGNYRSPVNFVDEDRFGNPGAEALSLRLYPGDVYYLSISPYEVTTEVPYSIRVELTD